MKNGIVDNLQIQNQPVNGEGKVSIAYTLAHPGGQPYTDKLYFLLYAPGQTLPQNEAEREYPLYPDQPPIIDALEIPLTPGNYQLQYHSTGHPAIRTAQIVVQPTGIGVIAINPAEQYPPGPVEIPYTVTNTDTLPGRIPVTLTLTGPDPGDPPHTETRNYHLDPGETRGDTIPYEIPAPGVYTLDITGPKQPTPAKALIKVVNLEEISAQISISELEANADAIPVKVYLENTGYRTFTGTVVMEAAGQRNEEIIEVSPGSTYDGTIGMNISLMPPGPEQVSAVLYDKTGQPAAQTAAAVQIRPAAIKLAAIPENLEISAGSSIEIPLTLIKSRQSQGRSRIKNQRHGHPEPGTGNRPGTRGGNPIGRYFNRSPR